MTESTFEKGGPDRVPFETPPCMFCGGISRVYLTLDQISRLVENAKIQDALPELTSNQRELIMTGTHKECWDRFIPEESFD